MSDTLGVGHLIEGILIMSFVSPTAWAAFVAGQVSQGGTPPAAVLDRAPTAEDVRAYPEYYILGPGRAVASSTFCAHGQYLTDSCPCCP